MTTQIPRARLARMMRFIVRAGFIVLPFFFAWLKLRNLSLTEIMQVTENASAADIVWKSALIIYFFAWVWGASLDIDLQELVYLEVPNKGHIPLEGLGLALTIIALGAVLLWADTYLSFVSALAVFTVLDHVGWRYLVNFLRPAIEKSQRAYEKEHDYLGLEQLLAVENQICGGWKWWRGGMGLLFIAGMLTMAAVYPPNATFEYRTLRLSWGFVQACSIFVWVIGMELWHWFVRLKTHVIVNALEDLKSHYQLVPV